MSKAEKFIQDYTRNCSNEIAHWDIGGESVKPIYSPWLTPDHARSVAQIAMEEVIEEAAEWMKLYVINHDAIDVFEMEKEFKKAMEEKV